MNFILVISLTAVALLAIIMFYSSTNQVENNRLEVYSGIFASLVKASLIFNVPLGILCLSLFLLNTIKELGSIHLQFDIHLLTTQAIYAFIVVGIIIPVLSLLIGIKVSKVSL